MNLKKPAATCMLRETDSRDGKNANRNITREVFRLELLVGRLPLQSGTDIQPDQCGMRRSISWGICQTLYLI